MEHDANNVVEFLSQEWAENLASANRKIAILQEENRILREQLDGNAK